MLDRFLHYIGDETSFAGYQRSYKLVFYQCFFENEQDGIIAADDLAGKFRSFYVQRQEQGKITDIQPDPVIKDPKSASVKAVLGLILRNPFHAVSGQGYFHRDKIDGKDCFILADPLKEKITEEERTKILNLVGKKLDYYYQKIEADENASAENERSVEKPSVKERIERIKDYISLKGFQYPEGMIENFYLSLKSKPFVILAGASGTGKTQLVRLFAEAVGAVAEEETDEENQHNRRNRYKFMPVCPDRSDSAALFGYVNLRGKFVPGTIIDFLRQASCDPEYPYFLCLDGMNPARAENYLRDFLSVFETRRWSGGKIVTDEIPVDPSAEEKYKKLGIPENLYVIGTVNTDETTFPVSKKVLSHANTIEFSCVDLIPDFTGMETMETAGLKGNDTLRPVPQKNDFLRADFLTLVSDTPQDQREFVIRICEELQDINEVLQKARINVGYRTRDEIVFYMLNNRRTDLLGEEDAMDYEILQKILPRIQGNRFSVGEVLCELFRKFAGDFSGMNGSSVSGQMQAYLDTQNCRYRKSAEKVCRMMRRLEEDGVVSCGVDK